MINFIFGQFLGSRQFMIGVFLVRVCNCLLQIIIQVVKFATLCEIKSMHPKLYNYVRSYISFM